jgi:hypothetical protein
MYLGDKEYIGTCKPAVSHVSARHERASIDVSFVLGFGSTVMSGDIFNGLEPRID